MTAPTLVVFAYHFPPDPAIGGARPYRFFKYLKRIGYNVQVITASPQTTPAPDINYLADPFTEPERDFGWQVERAVRRALLPGVLGMRWAHHAARRAREILRTQEGKATVLSTCPPFGTHYAGWLLSRAAGIPWIADFRDPFGGVSLKEGNFNPFYSWLFNTLESGVIRTSDLVVANTDAMASLWQQQHEKRRNQIKLIWNGFDPEVRIAPLPLPERPAKVLSHVGELYAGRTATPILQSVARLIDTQRLRRSEVNVTLVGQAKSSALPDAAFLEKAGSEGWLRLSTVPVSPKEAGLIAQTSDGLLLIQPQSNVQVPGKLFEYLQIGRPILAYIQRDSPIERILVKSGVPYRCVYTDFSAAEMDSAILEFFGLTSEPVSASPWFEKEFRADFQAEALHTLIESVHMT